MSPRAATYCLAGLLLLILGATSQPSAVNERCPVMPEELAKAVHEITFRGVPVRFCCQQCKTKFLRNPDAYLAHLPHVPKTEVRPAPRFENEFWTQLLSHRIWNRIEEMGTRWRWLLVAVLCVLVVHLAAVRWQRKRVANAPGRSLGAGVVRIAAQPSTLLILLVGMGLIRLVQPTERFPAQGSGDVIAPSLHVKAGEFQAELGRQGIMQGPDFVSLLEKTYYRGNDDRSPKLFNGGIYRTCEFRISLRTADGKVVVPGERLPDEPLRIRVEIHRGKNTMGNHFQDTTMAGTTLVARGDLPSVPLAESADAPSRFKVVQPGQAWAAEAAIGEPVPTGIHHLRGTILICPATTETEAERLWPTAQYGIAYRLRFQDGALQQRSSKLWMGALVFTDDLPDEQFNEWLDTKPIPEVPDDFHPPAPTQPTAADS